MRFLKFMTRFRKNHVTYDFTFPTVIYRVSQLFPAILQGVIYDVNWNNFYPKHFSFLRRFKKLQNVANIDIFEKKLCFLVLVLKMFTKHNTSVVF